MAYDPKHLVHRKLETDEDWGMLEFQADREFTPSTPIRLKECFNGRRSQIKEVTEAISQVGRHAVIHGERGVGKSSLAEVLHLFLSRASKSVCPFIVLADNSDDFTSLWRKVFEEIAARHHGTSTKAIDNFIEICRQGEISPTDVRRSFEAVFKKTDLPIIIIDEFNEILDSNLRNLIANTIKGLSDRGTNVTLIIVGVGEDVTQLIENYKSVERSIAQIPMYRMRDEEMEEIIESRAERLGMTFSEEALWKIVNLSRGLPQYVHNLGWYAAKSAIRQRRRDVEEKDVDLAIENVIKIIGRSAADAYGKATYSNHSVNLYRHVLLACALTVSDEDGYFRPQDACKPLGKILEREVKIATFQRHLPEFLTGERATILSRKGEGRKTRYRFSEPIMQPYTILKGIRDGLVSGEAKSLLSYERQRSFPI